MHFLTIIFIASPSKSDQFIDAFVVVVVVVVVAVVVISKRQSNRAHLFNINLDNVARNILLMQRNRQFVSV